MNVDFECTKISVVCSICVPVCVCVYAYLHFVYASVQVVMLAFTCSSSKVKQEVRGDNR